MHQITYLIVYILWEYFISLNESHQMIVKRINVFSMIIKHFYV